MNRPTKIAHIIAQRQPLAQKIAQVEQNLHSLSSALSQIEKHRNHLIETVDDIQIKEKLQQINVSALQPNIISQINSLKQLKARFSRNTLNIGVVGETGAGKSTLLKTLSGLSDNEIPAFRGGACTAVRSKITNQKGNTTAEVVFHSESSFLQEVIQPYYSELDLGEPPNSLNGFANQSFPEISESAIATKAKMYRHLRDDYYNNITQFQNLLQPGSPRTVSISQTEIPNYVIQKRDQTGELTTFNHLAVREVRIFCPFAEADVEQITLVDVPGMGDTRLGDEKLMLETLGKEVDVVIFVQRPDPFRYLWKDYDLKLYENAQEALDNLEKKAFIILNHQAIGGEGNNLEACQNLQGTVNKTSYVSCEIADCSNSEEVKAVFDHILDYLADNITDLDQDYALACENYLLDIQKEVHQELDNCRHVFGQDLEDNYQEIEELFSELFGDDDSGWWREVVLGLQGLRAELWHYRQVPDEDLQAAVAVAVKACEEDKGILSSPDPISEINDRIRLKSAFRAYPDYQDELRVLISHHFLSLDEGLHRSLESVKAKVVAVLVDKGKLGHLIDSQDADFLRSIATLIPDKREKLKKGFKIIAKFEISYRSMILPRIRQYLDGLTNISAMAGQAIYNDESPDKTLEVSTDTTAEDILTALEIDYEKAVNKIQPALEELLCEPSQAAYAMVEEFTDNVIRQKGIRQEWKNFLRSVRGKIWSEEFGKAEQEKQMRREWLNVINQVTETNKTELFQFIK